MTMHAWYEALAFDNKAYITNWVDGNQPDVHA